MTIESEKDLTALRKIGEIVAVAREEMLKKIRPGITTGELDAIGEGILARYGAKSAPRYEYNFPGATCISVNDEVAHGIPGSRVIKEGDMVNVDVSAELNGFFADTGSTIVVEPISPLKSSLCACSQSALHKAIEALQSGRKINQIGRAIMAEARKCGFTVIKNLCGHGIGRKLHEKPNNILNYYNPSDFRILNNGLVLAVETFISTGAEHVIQDRDGWTLKTPDKSLVAQFEHTVVVTRGKPIILTAI